MTTYVHEAFDQPGIPGHGEHDENVPIEQCLICHDAAHAQYEAEVQEIVDGAVWRDTQPVINPDDTDELGRRTNHYPVKFLLAWHDANGHCPLLTGT